MVGLVAALNAAATLAFGAVYPWGYIPLLVAAGSLGGGAIVRHHALTSVNRALATSCLLLAGVIALQLVPLPRPVLEAISPHTLAILQQYQFGFPADSAHSLSLAPADTAIALAGFAAFAIYLLCCSAGLSPSALRALPVYLMLFAVPLALFGIVSRELNNGLVYWFWKPKTGGGAGAFGPFINRNHFAGWMLMASCLSIGSLLGEAEHAVGRTWSSWRDSASWLSSRAGSRLVLTSAAISVMAVSLVWTMSRSGIACFTIAIGCFIWALARRRQDRGVRRSIAIIGLLSVLALAVGWRGVGRVTQWFGDTNDILSRLAAWGDGWHVVQDFPIAGTGLNTYSHAMLFYQRSNIDLHLAQAHNDYLQLLAEGGVLVAVPALIVIVSLVVAVRSNLNACQHEVRGYWIRAGAAIGMLAIGVQEFAEFSLQIPANAFLFCTLAALALMPARSQTPAKLPGAR